MLNIICTSTGAVLGLSTDSIASKTMERKVVNVYKMQKNVTMFSKDMVKDYCDSTVIFLLMTPSTAPSTGRGGRVVFV